MLNTETQPSDPPDNAGGGSGGGSGGTSPETLEDEETNQPDSGGDVTSK